MHLFASSGEVVQQVQPALSTLDKSVIGALLIVSWGIAIVAIWQLIKTQNARIDDQKAATAAMAATVEKLTATVGEVKAALDKGREADTNSAQAMNNMQQAFQMFVVSRSRSYTPSSFQAIKEKGGSK